MDCREIRENPSKSSQQSGIRISGRRIDNFGDLFQDHFGFIQFSDKRLRLFSPSFFLFLGSFSVFLFSQMGGQSKLVVFIQSAARLRTGRLHFIKLNSRKHETLFAELGCQDFIGFLPEK